MVVPLVTIPNICGTHQMLDFCAKHIQLIVLFNLYYSVVKYYYIHHFIDEETEFPEVRWLAQGQILTQVVWFQCLYSTLYCPAATKINEKINEGAGLKAEKIISIFSMEMKHESPDHTASRDSYLRFCSGLKTFETLVQLCWPWVHGYTLLILKHISPELCSCFCQQRNNYRGSWSAICFWI